MFKRLGMFDCCRLRVEHELKETRVMISNLFPVVPFLFFILWLGLLIYTVVLATRLVNAVEQIARAMSARRPDSPLS